jgi:pyruvate dehydrogenase E1 component alpha subunit
MMLTRHFEETAESLYMRGLVHGTMHLSIGMEASRLDPSRLLDPTTTSFTTTAVMVTPLPWALTSA